MSSDPITDPDLLSQLNAKPKPVTDPDLLQQLNQPKAPPKPKEAETDLHFTDKVGLAAMDNAQEKLLYLSNRFGAKNVKSEVGEDGQPKLIVMQDGKRTVVPQSQGFWADLASQAPETVGMVAGSIAGTEAGPAGMIAGAIIGGAAGKVVRKASKSPRERTKRAQWKAWVR